MSEFPERCTSCGEEYHYFDNGDGRTQRLCNCNNGVADRELAYNEPETRTVTYQSPFDPQSPVHFKVTMTEAEQVFLDQCRAAWHLHAETTIKINGATKEFEANTKHIPRKWGADRELSND